MIELPLRRWQGGVGANTLEAKSWPASALFVPSVMEQSGHLSSANSEELSTLHCFLCHILTLLITVQNLAILNVKN